MCSLHNDYFYEEQINLQNKQTVKGIGHECMYWIDYDEKVKNIQTDIRYLFIMYWCCSKVFDKEDSRHWRAFVQMFQNQETTVWW